MNVLHECQQQPISQFTYLKQMPMLIISFRMSNIIIQSQFSMENQAVSELTPSTPLRPMPQTSTQPHNQFCPVFYYPQNTHQLLCRLSWMEAQMRAMATELEELRKMQPLQTQANIISDPVSELSKPPRRKYRISKEFTKHLDCPGAECRRKYSSRIALRAHVRRCHKQIILN